jgi:hypothetical protein
MSMIYEFTMLRWKQWLHKIGVFMHERSISQGRVPKKLIMCWSIQYVLVAGVGKCSICW